MEDLVATYLHISGKFFPSHLRNSSLSVEIRFVSNLEIGIFASMQHAAGLHNLPHDGIRAAEAPTGSEFLSLLRISELFRFI